MGILDFFSSHNKNNNNDFIGASGASSQPTQSQFAEMAKKSDPLQNNDLIGEIASRQTAWDNFEQIFGLLPSADPVLNRLEDGGQGVLESLTADAHVMSVVQTRKLGSLKKEFRFRAPRTNGTPEEQDASRKVFENWKKDAASIDFFELINQILNAPLYGMVPLELLWKPEQGQIRLDDIKALPARWFGFDEKNEPRFISEKESYEGEALPQGKFVFARHFPSYDNPYGLSLLSRCLWPVTFKKGGMKFWVQLAEKYGMPFLIGKYPQGTTPDDQSKLLNSLAGALRDFVMVAPEGGQVEMIHPQAQNGAKVHESLKDAMNDEISKVILGQNLTTEVKQGSYAASKTHADVLASYQESDQKLVSKVMAEILRIYTQIQSNLAQPPVFEWFEEEALNQDRASRDKELKAQGVEFSKEYYMTHYGLQESDFKIETSETATASQPPNRNRT